MMFNETAEEIYQTHMYKQLGCKIVNSESHSNYSSIGWIIVENIERSLMSMTTLIYSIWAQCLQVHLMLMWPV